MDDMVIESAPRGPHWIAWNAESRGATPVVMVGQTREEAEGRLREWLRDRQLRAAAEQRSSA
jgi:hypothetical protein